MNLQNASPQNVNLRVLSYQKSVAYLSKKCKLSFKMVKYRFKKNELELGLAAQKNPKKFGPLCVFYFLLRVQVSAVF